MAKVETMLTECDYHLLTRHWSRGPVGAAQPNLPHRRFAEHAQRRPDAVAVIYEGGRLTYAQLDHCANWLGHLLQRRGVGPGVVVGLYMSRCPELVVGILGVYKAGGACLFLETNAPAQRLRLMLAQVNPRLLLTTRPPRRPLPEHQVPTLDLDELGVLGHDTSMDPPPCAAGPNDLATVFLTSGSTGQPKAVMFPFGWYLAPPAVGLGVERHLLKTDSGTTFTRAEITRPLVAGQQLFIAPAGLERDPRGLAQYLGAQGITHLIATPTMLQALLALDDLSSCHALRSVCCSGEHVPNRLKQRFLERLPAQLCVSYGCTEAPGATSHILGPGSDPDVPTVGRPAAMMEAYVLDERMQPVPVGEEGEVYLSGQLAQGYLNDPDMTARRFLPHPFSDEPGARVFKTGDRGQWLPDGYLQILGRRDDQVKIRGYRIELTEIEAVLAEHPALSGAVLTAGDDGNGGKRLVAYCSQKQEDAPLRGKRPAEEILIAELREWLKLRLPGYMIPARFMIVPAFSLTANGKIDRAALPTPSSQNSRRNAILSPRNTIEWQLVAIWQDILKQSPVGVSDNFFDLGGHSLSAVQVMEQIEKLFHQRLPPDALWLNEGTIASLAMMLRNQYPFGAIPELVPIKHGSRPPLFVAHIMGGLLRSYQELASQLDPEQPVYGLQARGIFDTSPPDSSLDVIASHCIATMRAVQPQGPYLIAGYSSGGVVAYEMAQQLRRDGVQVGLLVMIDTYCPWVFLAPRWRTAMTDLIAEGNLGIRRLIYVGIFRLLGLRRRRKTFRNAADAHNWAHLGYRPRETTQTIEFFIAATSRNRAGQDVLGWSQWTKGEVRIQEFAGGHFELITRPWVRGVAARLQQLIDEVGKS